MEDCRSGLRFVHNAVVRACLARNIRNGKSVTETLKVGTGRDVRHREGIGEHPWRIKKKARRHP